MAVARTWCNDPEMNLIAFANNGTKQPNAFVLINVSTEEMDVTIDIADAGRTWSVHRTGPGERYLALGNLQTDMNLLHYQAPAGSVTTFVEI